MKVRRGDVVLVDYPFSDRTGSKVRPCLVVQNDTNNARLDDTIVVTISSRVSRAMTEATQLLVEIATPEGQAAGLLFDSAIQCENILTVDCQFVRRIIGHLSVSMLARVETCLKVSLALP